MSALSLTAKAALRHAGGRTADGNITATIFGAYGFVGRYVCNEFGRIGGTMVIPFRGCEMEIRRLKVLADLGNMASMPFSVRDRDSVKKAVEGSDVVINLIGKHYQTKHFFPWWINYTYDDVHVDAARTIAEVCTEMKIPKLIHHSSLLAKPNSRSMWAASKYRGEIAVRHAYPEANIVRSSFIYGAEDRFLIWYANRMNTGGVPIINGGKARLQPVFVGDVARSILAIASDPSISGKTFELVGDEEYTAKEIAEFVFDATKNEPNMVNLPLFLAKLVGSYCQQYPDPKFTNDLATVLTLDQVKTSTLPGLRELDIIPAKMENEAMDFLFRFKPGGHFQEVSGYH